ncbi:putative oxidoreductase [Dioscorea sansibarensis]
MFMPVNKRNHNVVFCNANGNLNNISIQDSVDMINLMPCNGTNSNSAMVGSEEGLGIASYLKGKQFLITGATGFLGKVLVEKILRTTPDVGKIYVLIKAKDEESAMKRLKCEIINTELFRRLREMQGKNYQAFMLRKLVPVVGNVREAELGLEPELANEISREVDVIVNSAANTTFDERYDVALDINTLGPSRLMSFAKRFHKLKLFLQVSTAYVNGQRQGNIPEKPFCIGDTIASETLPPSSENSTRVLDVDGEIKLASQCLSTESCDASLMQKMKNLGLERAKMHGWQDTYVFTKAMGEMVINEMRGSVPVIVVRPSVIESTYQEPFPGWMEGNRQVMMDPIILHYGKGQLTGFLVDPNGVLDVVPADMVVNSMLAAMAKHGSIAEQAMHVYHIASSVTNPLIFQDLAHLIYEHFNASPCVDSNGRPILVPRMRLFGNMNDFSSYILEKATWRSGRASVPYEKLSQKLQNLCMKSVDQAKYLASIYKPYTFYGGRFDNTNTQQLMQEMSEEERRQFGFDVGAIDWKDYITNVHIPGLRRHVMKGRGMPAGSQLVATTL